ncbi:MAG: serine/threonine protein kinase, partial [Labilithrix sp.]|nr:serine/threonine protein kinase [Labilithrix sp.]
MSTPSSSATAKLPTTGDVVDGKYVLERLLGQGGMGAVYAARHRKLGHAVAIKVMLADAANHEAASRFVNEGRAAANIQNEHVVRVSDVDEENGYAYMVLELLEGEDLAQLLERERRLPPAVAVAYVMQALDGVRQAHAQGIVHRDLKPSNLFLAKRHDGTSVIKVLDFGISKAGTSNPLGVAPGALTSTKAMLGSPLYMSPEQLRSSKSVDARADIWATGVILYELCTGKLPFMGENLGELFAQILEVEAPPLRALVPEAPAALEAIVAKCLQRRPEHRFQSVAELERELAPLLAGASNAPFAAQTAMMSNTPQLGGMRGPAPSGQYGPPPGMQHTPNGGLMGPPPDYGPAYAPAYGAPPHPAHAGMGPSHGPPGSLAGTGSGAHVPVVKGTGPFGANTPQPTALNDGAWQNTGSRQASGRSHATTLAIGAFAVVAVVGLAFAGLSMTKRKVGGGDPGVPSASTAEPTAVLSAPPRTSATIAVDAVPSASASATASASA